MSQSRALQRAVWPFVRPASNTEMSWSPANILRLSLTECCTAQLGGLFEIGYSSHEAVPQPCQTRLAHHDAHAGPFDVISSRKSRPSQVTSQAERQWHSAWPLHFISFCSGISLASPHVTQACQAFCLNQQPSGVDKLPVHHLIEMHSSTF